MWEAIIGCSVSPEQVLLCMAALKMAREAGQHEQDNMPDAIGYLSMMDEVRETLDNRMTQAAAKPHAPEGHIRREGDPYPPPRAG